MNPLPHRNDAAGAARLAGRSPSITIRGIIVKPFWLCLAPVRLLPPPGGYFASAAADPASRSTNAMGRSGEQGFNLLVSGDHAGERAALVGPTST